MQKQNPVIKNYIFINEKKLIKEKPVQKITGNRLCHILLKQNKAMSYPLL